MFSEFVCFSSLCCRLLSGEFFPLLCSLAWLAVAFFRSGLLCTAELRFSDQFFGPCSHVVGMCSCKARRFVEALRSSWIFTFAPFLFASAFFFGLVCSAPQSCGFRTGFLVRVPTSWGCVLAKQEGSLKLCALLGFLLLRFFFVCFRFFWSGLLCTAELRFSDRFFSPCSHVVGMCSCKARRFAEALRSSWIFTFALFCLLPPFLVWFAVHARTAWFSHLRTCSKDLRFYLGVS